LDGALVGGTGPLKPFEKCPQLLKGPKKKWFDILKLLASKLCDLREEESTDVLRFIHSIMFLV
jgi:hypothetical protein